MVNHPATSPGSSDVEPSGNGPPATSQAFRIAHLSDLHLTSNDNGVRTETKVFKALRGMNAAFRKVLADPRVQGCDLVLVTGDVTDRGEDASWDVFWKAIGAAGLLSRTLVVPGNHDVCCLDLRLPWNSDGATQADVERAARGLQKGGQKSEFPWVVLPAPGIAIFGLNSNNLGNSSVVTNAMGVLGYRQLEKLARALYQHRNVPVKIVALHHSPNIPHPDTERIRRLSPTGTVARLLHELPADQRLGLRLLCAAHRVRLVVHGHLHRLEARRIAGTSLLGAPATTDPWVGPEGRVEYRVPLYTVAANRSRVTREIVGVAAT